AKSIARAHDMSWVPLLIAVLALAACGGDDDPTEQITDLEFSAFVDGNTAGEPVTVRLSDWFAENSPGTRILMVNAAAGWCVPCMREAEEMPDFAADYQPQGVAILTAVFQDQNGDPADREFVKTWVDAFALTLPALIDTDFQTGAWFDVNTMPANMFVDAETREILTIAHGTEVGDDPMQEYRELLDHYLAQ
ncbi:MAG TPA: TlpA disulfide reductase family protein, partial [Kofleriaceae bacterium]|nr:TlpA disulfide reductase family protein [Kofleriaceae bacterium]